MSSLGRFNDFKIWVRLVTVILAGTICSGVGLVYWATLQQKKIAVDQARDFAESINQMTMAGLTGMMITGTIAQRNIFLDQIRDSNHIESLKVFRGGLVVRQFGQGRAGELPDTAHERSVLESGNAYYEVFAGADGSEKLRAILPAIALKNYLGKNCIACHNVEPGAVLGAVSMEISLARANQTVRVFGVSALGAAAVFCMPLALFIWYFISHLVTRPLRQMTSGLIQVADGDLEETSHLRRGGKDEIGQATEAFNRVMDKVQDLLSEQRLSRIVFENSLEGIAVTDADSRFQLVNRAFTEATGYAAEEVAGLTPAILKSGKQDAAFYREFWRILLEQGEWRGEIWNRRKNGSIFAEWLNICAVKNRHGDLVHYVAIFSDITERKKREERITFQAFHDSLTGLPNRILFLDRVEQMLAQAKRAKSRKAAVMFLDLDHFKEINDSLGHDAGDALLKEVAYRVRECVRASDTVARMGGDEFTILLPAITEAEDARAVAQKILDAMKLPILLAGQETVITTSIGISLFPQDGRDGETLLKHADAAMYKVKGSGRAAMSFFVPELMDLPSRRVELEAQLRQAVERREFVLQFQPLVDLVSGRVYGREALLRWQDPTHGLRLPEDFLALAVETGLILPIGEWVYEAACLQAHRWQSLEPGMVVAINLSEPEFYRPDVAAVLGDTLRRTGLAPQLLEVDIGETLAMKDAAAAESIAKAIADRGIGVAIDDFGSGYFSLLALRHIPLHALKVDQALVKNCLTDHDSQLVIRAIAATATLLGLSVVAKGVDSPEKIQLLRRLACQPPQESAPGHPEAGHL